MDYFGISSQVIHCAGHTIDLVVQDVVSVVPMFRDSLHVFGNLDNFVRDSPKTFAHN